MPIRERKADENLQGEKKFRQLCPDLAHVFPILVVRWEEARLMAEIPQRFRTGITVGAEQKQDSIDLYCVLAEFF